MPMSMRIAKENLRKSILARRAQLSAHTVERNSVALAETLLATPEVSSASCIAAYISVGSEPGTLPLIDELVLQGVDVLAPLIRADASLDWALYTGVSNLVPASHGLLEPTGPPLGSTALARADVVIVPALTVDMHGSRLGRGGGFYDKALPHIADDAFTCALIYDFELAATPVPHEEHDVRMDAAATPRALHRFTT